MGYHAVQICEYCGIVRNCDLILVNTFQHNNSISFHFHMWSRLGGNKIGDDGIKLLSQTGLKHCQLLTCLGLVP